MGKRATQEEGAKMLFNFGLRAPCGFKGTRNFNIRRICSEKLRKHSSKELFCYLFFVFCMTQQFHAGMWTHSAQCFDTY